MPAHPQAFNTRSDRHTSQRLSPPPDIDRRTHHPPPSQSSSHSVHGGPSKRLDTVFFPQSPTATKIEIASQNGQHGRPSEVAKTVSNAKHLPLRKRITKDPANQPLPIKNAPAAAAASVAPPGTEAPGSTNAAIRTSTTTLQQQQQQQQQQNSQPHPKERRVSYPPTPTSSHDAKTADYYSTKEASPQSEHHSDGGETTETEDDRKNEVARQSPASTTERRVSMPLLSSFAATTAHQQQSPPPAPPSNIPGRAAPTSSINLSTKMKPLKKVQHWISKGKMNTPPTPTTVTTNGQVAKDDESFTASKSRPPSTPRRLSWEEDDRPPPAKRSKRGRPPASMTKPNSAPASRSSWTDTAGPRANGRPRTGESIVAAAMAAAKGSRRNSLRQIGAPVRGGSHGGSGYSEQVLYCICRKPYDVPRFMIACDRCDQWFHGECIGISEKEGEFIDLYFCDDCANATGKMTSWKPKCVNPACPKPARISSHQGRLSKYCSNTCGLQVARARLELAEIKRRAHSGQSYTDTLTERHRRARAHSQLVKDDRKRLAQLMGAWRRIRSEIAVMDRRLAFLKAVIQRQQRSDPPCCGLDTRLNWPDSLWRQVSRVDMDGADDMLIFESDNAPAPAERAFTTCRLAPCQRHAGWQDLKLQEFEQDRSELFHALTRYVKQRKEIKERIRRRCECVDDEWMSNTTIVHKQEVIK